MNKTPYSTYVLLAVNLLVFGWLAIQQQSWMMESNSDWLAMIRAGANVSPLTLGDQPWRMITSMFLHYGVVHLFANMFALYSMGTALEPAIGTVRFTLLYFFCGIVASVLSLIVNVYLVSVGASGAVFGLCGYRLAAELIGSSKDRKQLEAVLINLAFFVFVNGVITAYINVDLWGHIGGFIGGAALGFAHFKWRLLIKNKWLAVAFIPLVMLFLLLPRDEVKYYRIFQKVIATEKKTNQLYEEQLSNVPLADSLHTILDEWDLIDKSFGDLKHVPKSLRADTMTMRRYVNIHRRETGFRLALIEKESYIYIDSIEYINTQFDSLPPFVYHLNYNASSSPVSPDTTVSSAPPRTQRRIFYDAAWKETDDPSTAIYYRVGLTDSLGRWQGAVKDFFRDGTVQMKGTYKDNLKDGVFLYYTHHGTYSSAGRYEREEAVGRWESYFWNGQLRSEAFYNDRAYIRTVWDSLGNEQVTGGNGIVTEWYSNGQISQTGSYINGRKEGDWFGYHENGKAYFREVYRDNKLIKGVSEDKTGRHYVYDELSMYAYPVQGMGAFKTYVDRNIKRSSTAAGSGTVKVVFNVGNNGDLWEFVILEGIDAPSNAEAIRLIKDGPAWRSGLLHGQEPQPSQGYAEINF